MDSPRGERRANGVDPLPARGTGARQVNEVDGTTPTASVAD